MLQVSMCDVTIGYFLLSGTLGSTTCTGNLHVQGRVLSILFLSFSVTTPRPHEYRDIVTRRHSVLRLVTSVTCPEVVYELLCPELRLPQNPHDSGVDKVLNSDPSMCWE